MNNPPLSAAGTRSLKIGLLLAVAAFAGCHELDLGPAPDNYVGPKNGRTLTFETPDAIVPAAIAAAAATMPDQGASSQPQPATRLAVTQPAATQAAATQNGALSLTVEEALLTALENNPSLHIDRLNPLISRTREESARAEFDPTLSGGVTAGRTASDGGSTANNSISGTIGVQEYLPTGTTVNLQGTAGYSDPFSDGTARVGVTVSQKILQGGGLDVNLANLRQAQLDTKVSQYRLRDTAENLIAQVEQAYWDYATSLRAIQIVEDSLRLAQDQLDNTNELIRVGRQAESERAAAEAQVALQKESLIDARALVDTTRLTLLRLLNPGKFDFWNREVVLAQQPFVPKGILEDAEAHVNVAMVMRPDLNERVCKFKKGDLEIVVTKNGLLPQLNFFINVAAVGNSKTIGGALGHLNGTDYEAQIGATFSQPIGNAAARAAYRSSILSQEQVKESLDNSTQEAQLRVRTAYIDVIRLKEQITATAATRLAQEVNYNAEVEKFKVGRSTALLVSTAQNALESAQISEIRAIAGYLKSLISLYQQEGSLLERRGIAAPGNKPVTYIGATAVQPTSQPATR